MDWNVVRHRAAASGSASHWVAAAGAVAAVLIFVWWAQSPTSRIVQVRLPGADRPDGAAAASDTGDVFARASLKQGTGKPADIPGSWPGFRGAALDGTCREPGPLARSWPGGKPREVWRVEAGEGFAGPSVADGRVYLMDYDREAQRDALRCLSLADGAEIWRQTYPVSVKRNHGMTRTTPVISNGFVVAIGPRCHVLCVDAASGALKWGLDLAKDFGATVPPWYTGQCPVVDSGAVILAPGGPDALLMAVELGSGAVRWKSPNPNGWKMTHSSVLPVELAGFRVYLYCASGGVVAVDARDGTILWETTDWKINIATVPTPVLMGANRVFFTGGYNAGSLALEFTASDGRLQARELFRLKAKEFGATQHSPVWRDGHLYGIRADGQFVCLDGDGRVAWTSGPQALFGLGPLLVAGDLIYAMDDHGTLTLLEATPKAYSPLAQAVVIEDGHESWAPLALAGGRLLARDLTRLVCLEVGE